MSDRPQFTNTAQSTKQVWLTQRSASQSNCEFCTAAGACNLVLGTNMFTSGDAAQFAGLDDKKPAGGISQQCVRIEAFVVNKLRRRCVTFGSAAAEAPCAETLAWMQAQLDGTVFAVYASGTALGLRRSHWLTAMRSGSGLHFFDFQTNREYRDKPVFGKNAFPGGRNPSSCRMPFVGVITQLGATSSKDLHSSDPLRQTGMFDPSDTTMVVLAFPPD